MKDKKMAKEEKYEPKEEPLDTEAYIRYRKSQNARVLAKQKPK